MLSHMYKTLLIYLIFTGLDVFIGFLLLSLITGTITPEEYGKIGLLFALLIFIQPIIGHSAEPLVQIKRKFLSDSDFKKFLSNIYILSFIGFVGIEVILIIFSVFDGYSYGVVIFILPIICLSRYFINVRMHEFTIEGSSVKFGLSRLGPKLWTVTSLLLFYLIDHTISSNEYILIIMVSEIFVLFFIITSRLDLLLRLSNLCKKTIKEIISFGTPIIFATMPLWILNEYGKIMLNDSLEDVGLFTLAKQLSFVYVLACTSVSNTFVSKVLTLFKLLDIIKYFFRYFIIYVVLIIIYLFSFEVLSPFLFSSEYQGVLAIFQLLLIGCFFQVNTSVAVQILSREGKTIINLIAASLSGTFFLLSCYTVFENITVINVTYSYAASMFIYFLTIWITTYIFILRSQSVK